MYQSKKQIYSLMKVGGMFALVGIFCPFFWMRIFAGDYGSETVVYGLHSAAFIGIGIVLIGKSWVDLKHMDVCNTDC